MDTHFASPEKNDANTLAAEIRAIDTNSMKLFGEGILDGRVSFSSSRKGGTVFRFTHRIDR